MGKIKIQNSKIKTFFYCLLPTTYLLLFSCTPPPKIEKEPEIKLPVISEAKKHYSFGREYLKNKMWDDAIKNFELAIEESTSYVDAYIGLGSAYRGKKEYGEMERIYTKLTQVSPLQGHYALGQIYTDEGKYQLALAEYRTALEVDTTYADAWYGIGYVNEKMNDLQLAIKNYKHALSIDPENESIRYRLGKAYISHEEHENGIKELQALLTAHPADLDIRTQLGRAWLSLKRYERAKAEFGYITQHSSSNIAAHINLGMACEGLKEYKDAIQSYKEAISLDTTNIDSYYYLILLYIELNEFTQANDLLIKARQINPESQMLHYLAANILVNKGNKLFRAKKFDSSISNYNKALIQYRYALKGEDPELSSKAQQAIKTTTVKLKRAKEEKWWH